MFNAELSCFKTYSEAPALQDEYVFFQNYCGFKAAFTQQLETFRREL